MRSKVEPSTNSMAIVPLHYSFFYAPYKALSFDMGKTLRDAVRGDSAKIKEILESYPKLLVNKDHVSDVSTRVHGM